MTTAALDDIDLHTPLLGEAKRLPLRDIVLQASGLWLVTRAVLAVFTYFAVLFEHQVSTGPVNFTSFPPSALLMAWDRWDMTWYVRIAITGYDRFNTAGFFPLYPGIVHVVSLAVGQSHIVGTALLIANLATLAAFIGIALLAAQVFDARTASLAVRAFAAFPTAFFLAAGYADGLFIALAVFSLFFALRKQWYFAAGCAFAAAFTRPFAVILILPLAAAYLWSWRQAGRSWQELPGWRSVAQLGALVLSVPVALAIWAFYLWSRFGDPFAYLTAQRRHWDHYTVWPWHWFDLAGSALQGQPGWSFPEARILFDLLPVLILGGIALYAIRRLPLPLNVYSVVTLLLLITAAVPLDYDPLNSAGRHALLLIPAFVMLAVWMRTRPWLDLLVVGGGFLFQGLFTAFYLRGGWLV